MVFTEYMEQRDLEGDEYKKLASQCYVWYYVIHAVLVAAIYYECLGCDDQGKVTKPLSEAVGPYVDFAGKSLRDT